MSERDMSQYGPEYDKNKGSEEKKKLVELITGTAYAMIGREAFTSGDWRPFPGRYIAMVHQTSDPIYFQLKEGNILSRVSSKYLGGIIMKYWQTTPATCGQRLLAGDADQVVKFFGHLSEPFTDPISPVLFKSEFGYCFRRLPFDPKEGPTPTFDEMMSRTSNVPALKAWIGSLFDPDSERQQYCWIYGDGMNGKSSLAKFLQNIFEDSATSAQPPARFGDRFWSSQFLGKRLAVLPDCNDYTFVNSGLFKSHTGDDFIPIEEKNRGVYCVMPTWKFLILSNAKPSIEGEASAVRRAIYCEMQPIVTKRVADRSYQARLAAEASAFIYQCIEAYKTMAPDGGSIETDAQITQELTDAAEERWAFIANRHLTLYDESFNDKPYNEMPHVTRHYMRSIQKVEGLGAGQYQTFLNYLARKHGIKPHPVKHGEATRVVYIRCDTRGGVHYADDTRNGKPED